jgi:UDP-N-acetylmuramate dehydrogenase
MADLIADFPLLPHNTFGFDVKARYAYSVEYEAQLPALLAHPRLAKLPRLILGGGSNVVLTGDFDGVVWLVRLTGRRLLHEDADAFYVEAAAGENWHDFVAWTLEQGYAGLENLALIPGTVGAAPIQNIGAYGIEMAEHFDRLRAFDLSSGTICEFDLADCAFGYRDSIFKRAAQAVAAPRGLRRCGARVDRTRHCAAERAEYFRCGRRGSPCETAGPDADRQRRQFFQEPGRRRRAV